MNMNSSNTFGAYKMFFATLANDSRLVILSIIRNGPKNLTEICKITGFEQSMVSHNMKLLEYHGMIFVEKKGKFKYYSLNKNTIKPLLDLIDQHTSKYCCKILEGKR